MKEIKFRHWKTGEVLTAVGTMPHYSNKNPQSDRIVLKLKDGSFVDIIKDTIIEVNDIKKGA